MVDLPWHPEPDLHFLVLLCVPPPHMTEHSSHVLQDPQPVGSCSLLGNQSSRQAVDSSSAKINDETVLMRLPEHVLTNYCYTMLSNIWEIQDKKIIKTLLLCFSI